MIKIFVFYETAKEKVGPGFQAISQCLLPEDAQFLHYINYINYYTSVTQATLFTFHRPFPFLLVLC